MLDKEDLKQLSDLFDSKLEPINQRLDRVEQRLDVVDQRLDGVEQRLDGVEQRLDDIEENIEQLKIETEITRDNTNSIGEWIEFYFNDDRPYPLTGEEKKIV